MPIETSSTQEPASSASSSERNIANAAAASEWIESIATQALGPTASRDERSAACAKWLATVARKAILRSGETTPYTSANIAAEPEWIQKSIAQGRAIQNLALSDAERRQLLRIVDWMASEEGPRIDSDWARISLADATAHEAKWVEAKAAKSQSEQAQRLADEGETPVPGLEDLEASGLGADGSGWKWVELSNAEALEREGQRMHHCVAIYAKRVSAKESRIFSLRGPDGLPRATVETRDGKFLQLRMKFDKLADGHALLATHALIGKLIGPLAASGSPISFSSEFDGCGFYKSSILGIADALAPLDESAKGICSRWVETFSSIQGAASAAIAEAASAAHRSLFAALASSCPKAVDATSIAACLRNASMVAPLEEWFATADPDAVETARKACSFKSEELIGAAVASASHQALDFCRKNNIPTTGAIDLAATLLNNESRTSFYAALYDQVDEKPKTAIAALSNAIDWCLAIDQKHPSKDAHAPSIYSFLEIAQLSSGDHFKKLASNAELATRAQLEDLFPERCLAAALAGEKMETARWIAQRFPKLDFLEAFASYAKEAKAIPKDGPVRQFLVDGLKATKASASDPAEQGIDPSRHPLGRALGACLPMDMKDDATTRTQRIANSKAIVEIIAAAGPTAPMLPTILDSLARKMAWLGGNPLHTASWLMEFAGTTMDPHGTIALNISEMNPWAAWGKLDSSTRSCKDLCDARDAIMAWQLSRLDAKSMLLSVHAAAKAGEAPAAASIWKTLAEKFPEEAVASKEEMAKKAAACGAAELFKTLNGSLKDLATHGMPAMQALNEGNWAFCALMALHGLAEEGVEKLAAKQAIASGKVEAALIAASFFANAPAPAELLADAVRTGNPEIVEAFIPSSNPLHNNSEALSIAAGLGNAEIVEMLMPLSDPAAADSKALEAACSSRNWEIAKRLWTHCDPDCAGGAPLAMACKDNRIDIAEWMVQHGADPKAGRSIALKTLIANASSQTTDEAFDMLWDKSDPAHLDALDLAAAAKLAKAHWTRKIAPHVDVNARGGLAIRAALGAGELEPLEAILPLADYGLARRLIKAEDFTPDAEQLLLGMLSKPFSPSP